MPLEPGSRLGHYEIVSSLGAGGMGEVYRARDTKLGREVAIKLLLEEVSSDPERLARFEREARVLASLNHPSVATLHGFEQDGDTHFLVMELVEGETLADRIARGPVPVDEAISLFIRIAEGLEAAHEKGVIHRDLKPANIKVSVGGKVKILDFGLAKAMVAEVQAETEMPQSMSPTLTLAATQRGEILGTAAYMSPEQARGIPVDKRADVWAFGVCLFEAVTGARPFDGQDAPTTMARVLDREPDFGLLPAFLPWRVREVLRRCLAKDPDRRLRDVADARLELVDALDSDAPSAAPEGDRGHRPARMLEATILALAAAAVGVVATWWVLRSPGESPAPTLRLEIGLDAVAPGEVVVDAVLTPNASRLVYAKGDNVVRGVPRGESNGLFVRSLDALQSNRLVAGPALAPFLSPDGQWVGYFEPDGDFSNAKIHKISIDGGTPQRLAETSMYIEGGRVAFVDASWVVDDVILVSSGEGLSRLPANGGELELFAPLADGETGLLWPQHLPEQNAVIFTSRRDASVSGAASRIEVLDLATQERKHIVSGASQACYVATGHLVYLAEGTLFAVPFDLATLETAGAAVPLVEGIAAPTQLEPATFSIAGGSLAFLAGGFGPRRYPVVWADREGATTPLWEEPGEYASAALSPDDSQLALTVRREGNVDVWIYDLERQAPRRLTFDEGRDDDQVWSPDGRYLVFQSDRDGRRSIYRAIADGSGAVEPVDGAPDNSRPASFSPDGTLLAYVQEDGPDEDIWVLPLQGDRAPLAFLETGAGESAPAFSPDGRWIAYSSDESGRNEVYVRPYPVAPGKWQVSFDGGKRPRWSADGRELFYRTDTGIAVVKVDPESDVFRAGSAETLFEGDFEGNTAIMMLGAEGYWDYDVTGDGSRFAMFPFLGDDREGADRVALILNWFDELERLVPAD